MDTLVCPKCGTQNAVSSALCSVCRANLYEDPPEKSKSRWWGLTTTRQKVWSILAVFAIPLIFGPLSLGILIFFPFILTFPAGLLAGADLRDFLPASWAIRDNVENIVMLAGWLIYAGIVIAIMSSNKQVWVRRLFVALVILVVWNTAGCYPVVADIH